MLRHASEEERISRTILNQASIQKGALFIISTPIGHIRDVTFRAMDVLTEADGVICESFRQASTLLKKLGISRKELLLLDEHDEGQQTETILARLLQGSRLALISDCGTPTFQDPGSRLIARCLENSIPVKPVPGPSSLMTALSVSPLPINSFFFAGFLPQKNPQRAREFQKLKQMDTPIILMDTPYRLRKLLSEVVEHLGENRMVTLALDLTLPDEAILHGKARDILSRVADRKGEFVLIVH